MILRRCNLWRARGAVALNPRPKRVISVLPLCHASVGCPIASHHPNHLTAYRASSSDTFSNAIDKQNVSEAQRRAAQLELQQMNQSTSRILGLHLNSDNVSEVISEATVNEVKSAIHYWSRRWYMHFHPGFRRAAKGSALCASDFKTFVESTQHDAATESLHDPTNFSGDHGARQAEELLDWAISNNLVSRGAFESSMDQSRMVKEEHLGLSPNLPFVNIIETYLLPTVYGGVGNSIEESAREELLSTSRKNEYGTALKHSAINSSYVRALADATRVVKKMKHTQSTYPEQVVPDTLSTKAELNVWSKRAILLGRGTADDIALLRQLEEDSANEEGIEMYGSEADTVQGCMGAMEAIITQAETKFAARHDENLRPSVDWYNHFIGALARSDTEYALAKVKQVLEGMEAYGENREIAQDGRKCYAAPDVITYNGVLFCMTRDGSKSGAVEAKELLERMHSGTNNVRPDEVTYGTVLHSLAQAGMADEAERLLEFLEDAFNQSSGDDDCVTPSLTVYNTVLNALANSYEPHAPLHADSLLDRMKALSSTGKNTNVEPDAISISSVILAHARSKTRWGAERGEELLNRAIDDFVNEGNARVKPDTIMLNCALMGWTSLPDEFHDEDAHLVNDDEEIAVKRAENLLFRMLELTDQCDVLPVAHSFNIVLDCWAKSAVDGAADGALELLRSMSDYGVEPDEISYNSLLHAMSKESDPWWSTQADNIIREMREKNIPVSIITYNVLMTVRGRSMAKDGATRAEELLRNMENEGLSRNEISYNICIDAYARRGNHVEAERLLKEMLSLYDDEGDLSCRPSIHSFASVVNALAKSRDANAVARAEEIIQKAEELDYITLNSYLYNSFIDCIVNGDAPDKSSKAEAVLMKMEQQQQLDIKPSEYSYSMVLTCCARSGEDGSAERAERILNNMETLHSLGQSNVVANSRCYSAVITAFARSKSPDAVSKAFQLIDRMEKNRNEGSPHGHPNAHCYNGVVHAIAKSRANHKAKKCKDILDRMVLARDLGHRDCSPTIITYSTILNACAFDGKSHEEMREAFNLAKSSFQTLLESDDMEPNESIYANFLQCISRHLKPGRTRDEFAEAVFTEGCKHGYINAAVTERFKQAAPAPAHEILHRHDVIPKYWQRRAKA